jgi:GNAT superfamily N-acetyltransferase
MDDGRKSCSVCRRLQVVPGDIEDYRALAHYHYRDGQLAPFAAIYALRGDSILVHRARLKTIGVIVYTMPTAACELRNVATGGIFAGLDRRTRLALINKNIRRISRVIVEPRFRSLGLAARLVSETLPLLDVPIIEALAVMGLVNPFFEKPV